MTKARVCKNSTAIACHEYVKIIKIRSLQIHVPHLKLVTIAKDTHFKPLTKWIIDCVAISTLSPMSSFPQGTDVCEILWG